MNLIALRIRQIEPNTAIEMHARFAYLSVESLKMPSIRKLNMASISQFHHAMTANILT
jgi:hypothetical protein